MSFQFGFPLLGHLYYWFYVECCKCFTKCWFLSLLNTGQREFFFFTLKILKPWYKLPVFINDDTPSLLSVLHKQVTSQWPASVAGYHFHLRMFLPFLSQLLLYLLIFSNAFIKGTQWRSMWQHSEISNWTDAIWTSCAVSAGGNTGRGGVCSWSLCKIPAGVHGPDNGRGSHYK